MPYPVPDAHVAVPAQSELLEQTIMHPLTEVEICPHATSHLPSAMSMLMVPAGQPQS
jgi:hypothetical protein